MALAWEQMILNLVMSVAVLILLRIFHNRLDSLGVGPRRKAYPTCALTPGKVTTSSPQNSIRNQDHESLVGNETC
jgi:hypothetical protein